MKVRPPEFVAPYNNVIASAQFVPPVRIHVAADVGSNEALVIQFEYFCGDRLRIELRDWPLHLAARHDEQSQTCAFMTDRDEMIKSKDCSS